MNAIKHFLQDEAGSIAIEYALLVALVGLVLLIGAAFMGKQVCGIMNSMGSAIAGATPSSFTYTFAACA